MYRIGWTLSVVALAVSCGGGGGASPREKANPFGDRKGPKQPVVVDDDAPGGCKIKVDDSGFFVGEQRIDTKRTKGDHAVSQLRLTDGTTLVTDRDGETLWWVDCKKAKPVKKVLSSKEAALTTGELAPDGTAFVFQDGNRIVALDLESRELRDVYTTKQAASTCKANKVKALVPEDSFHGFAEDGRHIVVHRSMLCQPPDTHEVRIVKWTDPDRVNDHPAHVVYSVAADGKGNLWMADGGGLWRSTDGAETWKPVRVKIARQPDLPASDADGGWPVQVLADSTRNLVVVRTSVATGVVQGTSGASFPGILLRSKDGGATWTRLKIPGDKLVSDVRAIGGNVDELVVPGVMPGDTPDDEDDGSEEREHAGHIPVAKVADGARGFPKRSEEPPAPPPKAWIRTVDGGGKWAKASAPGKPAPITVGDDEYEATRDGLYRIRNELRSKVTKVIERPYARDLF